MRFTSNSPLINRWSRHSAFRLSAIFMGAMLSLACSRDEEQVLLSALPDEERPAILLITLDTTRADRLGIESEMVQTPFLSALAKRGAYFSQAYASTPTTLPAHASMFTGLYPADHGIRENGRRVSDKLELLAPLLQKLNYKTAAFVSGYPLAAQFGLARGFEHYDDAFVDAAEERVAKDTTDAALKHLQEGEAADFIWVHYFDAHAPYEPPEPFRTEYADDLYAGELAYMDVQIGRLVAAFEAQYAERPKRIIVAGDHGEGLGDHGEDLHGNLLYQGTMRVPLLLAGDDIAPALVDHAVSTRQIFDTVFQWAGGSADRGLLDSESGPVIAEALKPYLQYGWQPQYMAVFDGIKLIQAGDVQVFDVLSDPLEARDLFGTVDLAPELQGALSAYAARALDEPEESIEQQTPLSQKTVDRLASLGYVGSSGRPVLREVAPNPRDMVHLFKDLDIASGHFTHRRYASANRIFTKILQEDPYNFMAAMRLAVSHSVTNQPGKAQSYFERAREINPVSIDLRHYHAMHYLKYKQWREAEPLFESVLQEMPDRLPALQGLTSIYLQQGNPDRALVLLERMVEIKDQPGREWVQIGQLKMRKGNTDAAIEAFEKARSLLAEKFTQQLELGVLYLADRQFAKAAASLDRVNRRHPNFAMALFKRAQASVLLKESDSTAKVRRAWQQGNSTTRQLIAAEKLFQGIPYAKD